MGLPDSFAVRNFRTVFVALLLAVLASSLTKVLLERQSSWNPQCFRNLAELEACLILNSGNKQKPEYPTTLESLFSKGEVDKATATLPILTCPTGGRYEYSVSPDRVSYTIVCSGSHNDGQHIAVGDRDGFTALYQVTGNKRNRVQVKKCPTSIRYDVSK